MQLVTGFELMGRTDFFGQDPGICLGGLLEKSVFGNQEFMGFEIPIKFWATSWCLRKTLNPYQD